MSSDEQAIREVIATWMRASAAGDRDAVLGLMTEDVVFLTAGNAPMRGKAAFSAALSQLEGQSIQGHSDIQEIRVLGDWAWCWTELSVTIAAKDGGQPMRRAGNTLSVFRKENGRWLLARDANMLTTR